MLAIFFHLGAVAVVNVTGFIGVVLEILSLVSRLATAIINATKLLGSKSYQVRQQILGFVC